MRSTFSPLSHRTPARAGFSLIELSIVMAVIGLVIAGIWVAASMARENQKAADTVKGLLFIATQGRNLLTIEDTGLYGNFNTKAISMGIVPATWVRNTSIIPPSGGAVALWGSTTNFEIQFQGLEQAQCKRIVNAMGAIWSSASAYFSVLYDTTGGAALTFPLTPSSTYCPGTPTTSILLKVPYIK